MEVSKVNSVNLVSPALKKTSQSLPRYQEVSFKSNPLGNTGSNLSKKFWLTLRRLGNEMKNITEIKNAVIAAIGTGIIAPIVILLSPGKGDKQDKDKKFLQALRQPLSAALAFGFQVPTTAAINEWVDGFAYEKKSKFFRDDVIGDLIPTEKYIAKNIDDNEIEALERTFEDIVDGKSLKQELEAKIKEDYKEVGLEISDKKLAKEVKKKKTDFLKGKIASQRVEEFKNEKIQDILSHPEKYEKLADIKPIDLVTENFQNLAEQEFNTEFKNLEKNANLSFFDRTMRIMGFETKKTKALKDAQKAFRKEKGLEILTREKPEILNDKVKRLRNYIEAYEPAKKSFEGKKFWISLLINLGMVTISCFTLNWIHPKVNKWIENARAEKQANSNQKVEVA